MDGRTLAVWSAVWYHRHRCGRAVVRISSLSVGSYISAALTTLFRLGDTALQFTVTVLLPSHTRAYEQKLLTCRSNLQWPLHRLSKRMDKQCNYRLVEDLAHWVQSGARKSRAATLNHSTHAWAELQRSATRSASFLASELDFNDPPEKTRMRSATARGMTARAAQP